MLLRCRSVRNGIVSGTSASACREIGCGGAVGGAGTLDGALFGTAAYLLAEEWLSGITENWKVIFGPILVLVVLFARGGLIGGLNAFGARLWRRSGHA